MKRRGFLKGMAALGAAPMVPNPVLWTPEERQIVAATEMPVMDAETFADTANIRQGFVAVVLPPPHGQDKWSALVGEPIDLVVDQSYDRVDITSWHDSARSLIQGVSRIRLEAEMMPSVAYEFDVNPQQAISAAWRAHKESSNPTMRRA